MPLNIGGRIPPCSRTRSIGEGETATSGTGREPGYHGGMLPEGVHLLQGRGFVTSACTAPALDRTLRGMLAEGLV